MREPPGSGLVPTSAGELFDRYRVVMFDAYGVLCGDRSLLPGASEVLARLEARGQCFLVVTNDASRTPARIAERFRGARGEPLMKADQVVSAGLMALEYLRARRAGRPVLCMGPSEAEYHVKEAGCAVLHLDDHPFDPLPEVFVLLDEDGLQWERDLNRVVNILRQIPEVELLVPNPDLIYPREGGEVGIAVGSLAALLSAALGRTFRSFGKPGVEIYQRALERARVDHPDLRPEEVLFVGDSLATDIAGARAAGMRSLLVLSGNTTGAGLEAAMARAGSRPDHVAESITT